MENKKELSLKEYFLYTVLALCGFAIWYLGTAFVILELNCLKWDASTRFLVLTEGTITAVGLVAVTKITKSQQNY